MAFPAQAKEVNICDIAAQTASDETGVPVSVLRAITRTETGRKRGGQLEPWPWTVNMEGEGRWFETEDAARNYVFKHFKRGARSFDVGCFQINYKWHGQAFRTIDQMFDPLENARYAADFLGRLHAETGDWSKAAGVYHSKTPKFAKRYRARFDKIRQNIGAQRLAVPRLAAATPLTQAATRKNSYPLLQHTGASRSYGSLVPLGQSTGPSLIRLAKNPEGS